MATTNPNMRQRTTRTNRLPASGSEHLSVPTIPLLKPEEGAVEVRERMALKQVVTAARVHELVRGVQYSALND